MKIIYITSTITPGNWGICSYLVTLETSNKERHQWLFYCIGTATDKSTWLAKYQGRFDEISSKDGDKKDIYLRQAFSKDDEVESFLFTMPYNSYDDSPTSLLTIEEQITQFLTKIYQRVAKK